MLKWQLFLHRLWISQTYNVGLNCLRLPPHMTVLLMMVHVEVFLYCSVQLPPGDGQNPVCWLPPQWARCAQVQSTHNRCHWDIVPCQQADLSVGGCWRSAVWEEKVDPVFWWCQSRAVYLCSQWIWHDTVWRRQDSKLPVFCVCIQYVCVSVHVCIHVPCVCVCAVRVCTFVCAQPVCA